MGCCQSSAVTPLTNATPTARRMPWASRKRRRTVRPVNSIPVVAATQDTVEDALIQGTGAILPPLHHRPLHPGVILVREANPESRVDLSHLTGPTALDQFGQVPPTPTPPKETPTPDKRVPIDPTPDNLSPVGPSPALEDGTLQQQSESDSTTLPSTPQTPARMPATASPPTRPNTRVIRRYYPVPAPMEPFQRLHPRLTTTSYPGVQRLAMVQRHRWNCPVTVLPQHILGPVRLPPISALRARDDVFPEVQLHDPVSSGSSDEECVNGGHQAHQRRPPRLRQQAHRVPRPTAALPSRRREWARGLYDRFPPEEYNTRRGTYVRGSDDSSSSSSDSDSEVSPIRAPPTPPKVPEKMEIPDDPNILPRPSTRGGVAFDYLFEPNRPQTPMVPRPVSRRARRRRRRRTRAELDLQQRLAEVRRMQQREEMLARLRDREEREKEMREGMEKFMRSQLEKERKEKLRKEREQTASRRRPVSRLAHDDVPAFRYGGAH